MLDYHVVSLIIFFRYLTINFIKGTIMKLLILSDLHGNLSALKTVLIEVRSKYQIDKVILLGDIIDYGPHPNEVIEEIKNLPYEIVCNIYGNHEYAIMNQVYDGFSSFRGKKSAEYTRSILSNDSFNYLSQEMSVSGYSEIELCGKLCLAIHGSMLDPFWGSIDPSTEYSIYSKYDCVFSGHSHVPHYFERYFDCDNAKTRNRKKTIFINPGSVGQPRNLNHMAQYVVFDLATEEIILCKCNYNIKKEQACFNRSVDDFYRTRLEFGI